MQSNQLKVIESTPTITFGITGNTSVLNLLALYVPWGCPFCQTPLELPKPFNFSFSSTPQTSSGLHLSASELETRVTFPSIRDEFPDSDSGKFASLWRTEIFVGVNCIKTLMVIINLTLCMVIFNINNY